MNRAEFEFSIFLGLCMAVAYCAGYLHGDKLGYEAGSRDAKFSQITDPLKVKKDAPDTTVHSDKGKGKS